MASRLRGDEELAVSEVLGVVMLLAMVVTMMGGVFVMLTPYITDYQDNSSWANANGIAERLDGRMEVVGGASEGTGIKTTIPSATSSISPMINIETWTLSADLTADERIEVEYLNETQFTVLAYNESATSVTIWTPNGVQNSNFNTSAEAVLIEHNLSLHSLFVITIFDAENNPLHRTAQIQISGLKIITNVQNGEHEIALINDARYDLFPSESWSVEERPDLEIDELIDDSMRASLRLRDVKINGSTPNGRNIEMELVSLGPMELFSGDAWHFRFTYHSNLGHSITPQMHEGWLTDYTLNRASDTLDSFRGISPWLRASGSDGFTIDGGDNRIDLEIDLQRIEVNG